MRHIFLSPHMDDALLSAGSIILNLKKEKKSVLILTIFTKFGNRPISWDAQCSMLKARCITISSFENKRNKEDQNAMHALQMPYIHLGYTDGGYRQNRQNKPLYPTFNHLFSGFIADEDMKLFNKLKKDIMMHINKSDIIYTPLGIGNHADHILVNRVSQMLPNKTYYWLDQPYAYNSRIQKKSGYREIFRIPHLTKKETILACYKSQIKLLYPNGIPAIEEIFYEKNKIQRLLPSLQK